MLTLMDADTEKERVAKFILSRLVLKRKMCAELPTSCRACLRHNRPECGRMPCARALSGRAEGYRSPADACQRVGDCRSVVRKVNSNRASERARNYYSMSK